ncbi:hypothetical protein KCV01_g18106, partial [Aureobasidium melanogenum]
ASEVIEIKLGWYLLGRRFFIPWLRHFISPDPISPFGAGGLNRYGYCSGDPINRIDPSGNASFGWLGKLLGQLTGMAKTAAHAMAAVTPTTALTAISRAAEVVSVSVGIGAVVATALGDTQAAGVMGLISAGSLATGALGIATQAVGKSAQKRLGSSRSTSAMRSRPIKEIDVKDALFGASRSIPVIQDTHRDAIGYPVYEMRTMQVYQADWHMYRHPQNPESLHVVSDSVATSRELGNALQAISREGALVDSVTIYGNVHGYRHGMNRDPNGQWAQAAPQMFERVADHSNLDLSQEGIHLFDLSTQSAAAYRQNMRSNGAHIHYYCYSAASQDIINELQIGRVYPPIPMAPQGVLLPSTWSATCARPYKIQTAQFITPNPPNPGNARLHQSLPRLASSSDSSVHPPRHGLAMNNRTYGAYGYRVATTVDMAHTGYAGEVNEVTLGWYLLERRFFIPWLRRFISPDSVSPFGAGGLNRFAYCSGDPINRIDPSGHASFGWLGKLLGQLAGMSKNAAHAMASVTPTTALTTISRAAEVVSVSVGIGAVAAALLGDTSTAGIMGMIATGGGIAGMGVAGLPIAKSQSRRGGFATRHVDRPSVTRNLSAKTSYRSVQVASASKTYFGPDMATAHIGAGQQIINGQTHIRSQVVQFARADWHMQLHPKKPGSVHMLADSILTADNLQDALSKIPATAAGTQTFYINGHGRRDGVNRDPSTGQWADPAPQMASEINAANNNHLSNPGVTVFDVSNQSSEAYRLSMRTAGAHIHYYCYSGVSADVVQELGLGTTRWNQPPGMAPPHTVISESWDPPIHRI